MEDSKSADEDDDFFDASDDFPFYDCLPQSQSSLPLSPPNASSAILRRRRHRPPFLEPSNSPPDCPKDGPNSEVSTSRNELDSCLNEETKPISGYSEVTEEDESKPIIGNSEVSTSRITVDSSGSMFGNSEVTEEQAREGLYEGEINNGGQLMWMAELLVKAIEFQFRVLIKFVTFPFWVLYYCIMIFVNPFHVIGMGRSYLIGMLMKLRSSVSEFVSPWLSGWIAEKKPLLNLVSRCGWGLFWSVYVCSVLVTLLISAFVVGGMLTRYYVVEEPFELKQGLNFDYTKSKPEAFVPIMSCNNALNFGDEGGSAWNGGRVLSPNHKLQSTVTLILPESDYNRNLGIFQVRVEYLSEQGKSLASLSHPCMLKFRSGPIRLLLTLFKVAPLVAGYMSESQTLNLKFRGYRESFIPTSCVKVTIEQRAEFQPSGGIPEIYDAFLHIESELPFLKRIKWYWRRTIFVWLSMTLFVVELVFVLSCCRPLVIPRARTRGNIARNANDTPQS